MRCVPFRPPSPKMDITDSQPRLPPAAALVPSAPPLATVDVFDDDLSDAALTQLEAEIEQGLSSASPDGLSRLANGASTKDVSSSDDAMIIESDDEDVKQPVFSRSKKRATEREYFDPELYGLRRSVRLTALSTLCKPFLSSSVCYSGS